MHSLLKALTGLFDNRIPCSRIPDHPIVPDLLHACRFLRQCSFTRTYTSSTKAITGPADNRIPRPRFPDHPLVS